MREREDQADSTLHRRRAIDKHGWCGRIRQMARRRMFGSVSDGNAAIRAVVSAASLRAREGKRLVIGDYRFVISN